MDMAASALWGRLLAAGMLNSEAARLKLAKYLTEPHIRGRHKELMAARFAEVIVDEVQDCAPTDVSLLEFLSEAGINLVLVGDPDQAIYGFRGARYEVTARLTSTVPLGTRLAGNYRSSRAVCKLVDSLRSSGAQDRPVGRHASHVSKVQVLAFRDPQEIKSRSMPILESHGLPAEKVMVLAHSGAVSQRAAGSLGGSRNTTNRLVRLALAIQDLRALDASARTRAHALQTTQLIVRELSQDPSQDALSERAFLQSQNLTLRSFREGCLRLAFGIPEPFSGSPSSFLDELRRLSWARTEFGWETSRLRCPRGDTWPFYPDRVGGGLSHSTIHGFKGRESPAVILVIPKATQTLPNGIDAWEMGDSTEERRVLYVGASRAEELLILALHEEILSRVVGILQRDGVPYAFNEVRTEVESSADVPQSS
jgi:superfamily I DNA/RNA helicase